MEVSTEGLARFFETVLPHLNERQRRVLAGAAAQLLGNKTAIAEAAGMSRNTVIKADAEVEAGMEREGCTVAIWPFAGRRSLAQGGSRCR